MDKTWKTIQDFADKHKDMFFMVCSPKEDSILMTFWGLRGFVKFPGKDMSEGIIFNALRKSSFEDAIIPFTEGVASATRFNESIEGSNVIKVLNGGIRSIGEQKEIIKNKLIKNHGKTSKNKN